jgi:hypothetical protein
LRIATVFHLEKRNIQILSVTESGRAAENEFHFNEAGGAETLIFHVGKSNRSG